MKMRIDNETDWTSAFAQSDWLQPRVDAVGEPPTLPGAPPLTGYGKPFGGWVGWPLGAVILFLAVMAACLGFCRHRAVRTDVGQQMLILRAESSETELALRWEPSLPAALGASRGLLVIIDGAARSELALDGEHLRTGEYKYKPFTSDVTFWLTLVTAGEKGETASIRVLNGVLLRSGTHTLARPASQGSTPRAPAMPAALEKSAVRCYYLQVAALPPPQAESLINILAKEGYITALQPSSVEGSVRILVGPYTNEEQLNSAKSQLQLANFRPIEREF